MYLIKFMHIINLISNSLIFVFLKRIHLWNLFFVCFYLQNPHKGNKLQNNKPAAIIKASYMKKILLFLLIVYFNQSHCSKLKKTKTILPFPDFFWFSYAHNL